MAWEQPGPLFLAHHREYDRNEVLNAVPNDLGDNRVLSARGFKRVGRRSAYDIYTVWRCVGRGPGGSSETP